MRRGRRRRDDPRGAAGRHGPVSSHQRHDGQAEGGAALARKHARDDGKHHGDLRPHGRRQVLPGDAALSCARPHVGTLLDPLFWRRGHPAGQLRRVPRRDLLARHCGVRRHLVHGGADHAAASAQRAGQLCGRGPAAGALHPVLLRLAPAFGPAVAREGVWRSGARGVCDDRGGPPDLLQPAAEPRAAQGGLGGQGDQRRDCNPPGGGQGGAAER
mmetsp:Transcript_46042/g.149529  ORF Transcript_46042/g.149529 Transcript_46042/m.149529 type:complete len:215 (-) Transcript_46042:548-1192(-)